MSRNERWSTADEIKRHFSKTSDPESGAGPIIYVENGKKYSDDSEAHICVVGRTGKGKSQCCSLPFMREILQKGESLIMLDPKGEGYRKNFCYIPENYQKFIIDFRSPRNSPTKWNPLAYPWKMYRSKDPVKVDISSSLVSEFWNGVYPVDIHADRFWTDASINYARGLTYALFEAGENAYINLDSVAALMESSEERSGMKTRAKELYDALPNDSLAKRNLAAYVTGPNDTRASIHSVAASGLELLSRSRGLMEMLGQDTLDIQNIDVNKPFAMIIITPDETDVYDSLAGLLISQVSQRLILIAQELGGKLPIRVNIILEELGSVGKSIPTLSNLMVASRSRNMRLMLVLQSNTQLAEVYGKSKAETINSCIGITIGFSTNNWNTLNEWSQRCGIKIANIRGHLTKESLITASQLAAMPTCTALVMIENRYKLIVHFPFYDEMYDNSAYKEPKPLYPSPEHNIKTADFDDVLCAIRKKQRLAALDSIAEHEHEHEHECCNESSYEPYDFPHSVFKDVPDMKFDRLISQLDNEISELEAKIAEEKPKRKKVRNYVVNVFATGHDDEVIKAVAEQKNITLKEAEELLESPPANVIFKKKADANAFMDKIAPLNCIAFLKTNYY